MTFLPEPPPRSARSRPWEEVDLVALDFEATGLNFAEDRVISFGTVPIVRGGIDVGGCAYELVDPGDRPPDASTVVIHGLRPVDLRGGNPGPAARELLRAQLRRRFLVAWFASVEVGFLRAMFGGRARAWEGRVLDVRDLVFALIGEEGLSLSLSEAAERFEVPVASPHHALDDALVTAQLFLVTAGKLRTDGVRTIAELAALKPLPPPVLRRPRAPM
jgi:DNA polymerase-3 subunit epsilon